MAIPSTGTWIFGFYLLALLVISEGAQPDLGEQYWTSNLVLNSIGLWRCY